MRIAGIGLLAVASLVAAATLVFTVVQDDGGRSDTAELQRVLDGVVAGRGRVGPGATAYVSGPDGTWVGSAGTADIAADEPMPADARMRLESVSKIWTAVVVLQLAEDGVLRPGDSVERWLPGLLPYGDELTLAQLLTHRSGLIDNNDMAADLRRFIARVGDAQLRRQLQELAERAREEPAAEYSPLLWIRLAAWQPLLSKPGSVSHYSNIGFEILGLVAERAAGRPLPELYRELVFEPLGLNRVTYDPQGPIAGQHARGYRVEADGDLVDATAWHGGIGAEGGLVADAAETATFLTGLMRGRLLDDEGVAAMKDGLFWEGGESDACGTAYGHAGGGAGYTTQARVSGDGARVAVLLVNGRAGAAGDERAAQAIRRLYCAA